MRERRNVFLMIASIPFHILAALFCNIIRSVRSNDIVPEAIYGNLPRLHNYLDFIVDYDYGEEGHENVTEG